MNKSHLLINEPALQVLPSLAKSIGLEEAIILQQLHYWLNNSKVEGRIENGEKWIYNSYQEWQDNFPFWSVQQIQRIFLNLEKGGVVISAKFDAKKHDQTKFYRIDYDALCAMEHIKFDSSKVSESNDVNKELHRLPEKNKNVSLSTQDLQEVNQKVDYILSQTKDTWQGRELLRDNLLPLADWYNKATNQVMTKRVQKTWYKALQDWHDEGLTPEHLQIAFEAQSKWRMVSDPNQLTKDAYAIKAAGTRTEEPTEPKFKNGSGYV